MMTTPLFAELLQVLEFASRTKQAVVLTNILCAVKKAAAEGVEKGVIAFLGQYQDLFERVRAECEADESAKDAGKVAERCRGLLELLAGS
jgi:hypothetical protein